MFFSNKFNIHRTRQNFPNEGIDTFENMANEAAILALRQNKTVINTTNLVDAYEKITIGLPRLSKDIMKNEEELVAYHEAGHTITALLFRDFFDVRKVTINANTNASTS